MCGGILVVVVVVVVVVLVVVVGSLCVVFDVFFEVVFVVM